MTLVSAVITRSQSSWAASCVTVISSRPIVNAGMVPTKPILFTCIKYGFLPSSHRNFRFNPNNLGLYTASRDSNGIFISFGLAHRQGPDCSDVSPQLLESAAARTSLRSVPGDLNRISDGKP